MKVLAIIPAFNEAENIVDVVKELNNIVPWCDYVVINDGSRDNTAKICRENGFNLLDLPVNLGLSGAFQTGMRYACENGYEAVIQFDGDGQHDPKYIEQMVHLLENDECDLVIGSRFVTQKRPKSLRMVGNALIELLIRLTTGQRIGDPTSGMRMYGPKVLRHFATEMNYGPEPDTICFLMRNGVRVKEVQVEMRERTAGVSYLNFTRSIIYMLHMCMSIMFIQWFRKKG